MISIASRLFFLYTYFSALFHLIRFSAFEILRVLGLLPLPLPAPTHKRCHFSGVLVTGASSGIGRALALDLLQKGYTVFATVRRKSDGQDLVKAALETTGNLQILLMDTTNQPTIDGGFRTVAEWCANSDRNRLVAVVNNAGIVDYLPLEISPFETIQKVVDTNLMGVIRVSRAFLPLLRLSGGGRLITIGSLNGSVAFPSMSVYAASKHAIEGLHDSLRVECAEQGVHPIVIQAGSIATPIFDKTSSGFKGTLQSIPKERLELAQEHYSFIERTEKVIGDVYGRAISVKYVCHSLTHAIESIYPQTKYTVGLDAFFLRRLRLTLPDRMFDLLVRLATTGVMKARKRRAKED